MADFVLCGSVSSEVRAVSSENWSPASDECSFTGSPVFSPSRAFGSGSLPMSVLSCGPLSDPASAVDMMVLLVLLAVNPLCTLVCVSTALHCFS